MIKFSSGIGRVTTTAKKTKVMKKFLNHIDYRNRLLSSSRVAFD